MHGSGSPFISHPVLMPLPLLDTSLLPSQKSSIQPASNVCSGLDAGDGGAPWQELQGREQSPDPLSVGEETGCHTSSLQARFLQLYPAPPAHSPEAVKDTHRLSSYHIQGHFKK